MIPIGYTSRARLRAFLRLRSPPESVDIQVVEECPLEGYSRSLIRYDSPDGDVIHAFLFTPAGDPRAAVLALHQHNSEWTIGKGEVAGLTGDPLQAFGPALATRGILVLAPDAVGFESRISRLAAPTPLLAPYAPRVASRPDEWLQYYNHMAHRLVRGDLLMSKALGDCELAVTVLRTRAANLPIGVVGHSYGGTLALFLAALDTRLSFTCSSGAACSYRYKLAHGAGLDMALVIPGFAAHFDIDDLMRSVAPRRLFIVSADADPLSADADDLVQRARPAFEEQNCTERLQHVRVPGRHALDEHRFGAMMDWMAAQAVLPVEELP